jgi:hypothetical protein
MEKTKYHTGDVVAINKTEWFIESVTMRFGRVLTYGLEYKDENGKRNHVDIETGSLETLIKLGESK